jgi:hypothetical protein
MRENIATKTVSARLSRFRSDKINVMDDVSFGENPGRILIAQGMPAGEI